MTGKDYDDTATSGSASMDTSRRNSRTTPADVPDIIILPNPSADENV
jgi:hypothetical protein